MLFQKVRNLLSINTDSTTIPREKLLEYFLKSFYPDQIHLTKWKRAPIVIFGIFFLCLVYSKWRRVVEEGLQNSQSPKDSKPNLDPTTQPSALVLPLKGMQQEIYESKNDKKSINIASINSTTDGIGNKVSKQISPKRTELKYSDEIISSRSTRVSSLLRFLGSYFTFFSSVANYKQASQYIGDTKLHTLSHNEIIRVLFQIMKMHCTSDIVNVNDLKIKFFEDETDFNIQKKFQHRQRSRDYFISEDNSRTSEAQLESKHVFQSMIRATISVYLSTLLFIHGRISFAIVQSLFLVSENSEDSGALENDKHELREKILDLFEQRFTLHHFPKLKECIVSFFENNNIIQDYNQQGRISFEVVLGLIMKLKDSIDRQLHLIMINEESFLSSNTNIVVNNMPFEKKLVSNATSKEILHDDSYLSTSMHIGAFNQKALQDGSFNLSNVKEGSFKLVTMQDGSIDGVLNQNDTLSHSRTHNTSFDHNNMQGISLDNSCSQTSSPLSQTEDGYLSQQELKTSFDLPLPKYVTIPQDSNMENYVQIYDEITKREDYSRLLQACHKESIQCFLYRLIPEVINDEELSKESLSYEEWISRFENERSQSFGSSHLKKNQYLRILDQVPQFSYFCCSI